MRVAAVLLAVVALLSSCGDDDSASPRSSTTASTTSSTAAASECSPEPTLPPASDGSAAEVLAQSGDVQIAVIDHGASVDVVSLFVPADCELRPATIGGQPAALPIGGTVTHGDGLRCTGDGFEVLSATSDDGETYQATVIVYRLDGTELVEVDRGASTIEAGDDAAELERYYELGC